jgi:hypothetical protein
LHPSDKFGQKNKGKPAACFGKFLTSQKHLSFEALETFGVLVIFITEGPFSHLRNKTQEIAYGAPKKFFFEDLKLGLDAIN